MLFKFEQEIDYLMLQTGQIDHEEELKRHAIRLFAEKLTDIAWNDRSMVKQKTQTGIKFAFYLFVLTPDEFDKLRLEIRNDVRKEIKDKI